MFRNIAIGLALTLLAGCGATNNVEQEEQIVLDLWHYYNGTTRDKLDVLIEKFNETVGAEKNILVESRSYGSVSELSSAVVSAANKEIGMDDMPDIFSAYSDTALLLNDMEMVADMDQYFTQEEQELFQKDFLSEGRFDSEESLKIIPVAKSTEILFINKTDFDVFSQETGAQISQLETWEGMAQVAEMYYNWTDDKTEEPNDGRALFGVDSEANFMLVAAKQMNEEIYNYGDSITFGLSRQSAEKIWNTIMVPYIKGHYTAFGTYRSDDIKSGDLLVYAGSTSSVSYFPTSVELGREQAYEIEGTAMGYPYFEGESKVAVQQGAGMVVAKSDERKENASAEFLKWFTLAENNLEFAVSTGYIPVQNEALSFGSVLKVMEENSQGEIQNIVRDTANITYNTVMTEYEFYANKPFDGSYDTRAVLASSISNLIEQSDKERTQRMQDGQSEQEIIAQLSSEQAFDVWYSSLEQEMNYILSEK